ncbi:Carboxypeptidase S1-like protein A [Colletotrichum viniferum]|nr:Carboxypeptidase S1-like protein A [Colletotrichum viniferum]
MGFHRISRLSRHLSSYWSLEQLHGSLSADQHRLQLDRRRQPHRCARHPVNEESPPTRCHCRALCRWTDYDGNIIGDQMVADEVGAANWASAGFVDLSANSDGQVPGQVKQADGFSFTRLYFAGHVSAFIQPEAARRIQERVIKGVDIATGTMPMVFGKNLITKGPLESLFKQGMATVQTMLLPKGTTYDPHTHLPVLPGRSAVVDTNVAAQVDGDQDTTDHPLAFMTAKNIRKLVRDNAVLTRG